MKTLNTIPNILLSCSFMSIAFLSACESELPPFSWEGRRVRFATTHDELPCGDTLQHLDDVVLFFEEVFGVSLPQGSKISYYWLTKKHTKEICESQSTGCASNMVVVSSDPINTHELVHSIVNRWGRSHLFLGEGIAQTFGGPVNSIPDSDSLGDSIKSNLNPYLHSTDIDYSLAGLFTRYLIENYGLEKYRSIFEMASPSSDTRDFNGIFLSVLEVPVETILNDISELSFEELFSYMSKPLCLSRPISRKDVFTFEHRVEISCESESLIGPFSERQGNNEELYLEIPFRMTPHALS
jgi:hypothetical protein